MRGQIHNSRFFDKRYVLYLFLSIMALCLLFLSDSTASSTRDATVVWSLSPEEDVAGYNIHYGSTSRYSSGHDGYDSVDSLEPGDYEVEVQKAEYVLTGLDSTRSYWISVSAYDEVGNESAYSNEKRLSALAASLSLPFVSAMSAPSSGGGGCQMVPGSDGIESVKGQLVGWFLVFVLVPLWILGLRKRLAMRASRT